jgi:hypothetical protein
MTALSGPARSQSVLAELNEAWRCLCCGFCKQVSSFGSWPKSNSHAVACPIRAQYAVQLRSLTAIEGQPFSLHVRKLPSQSLSVLVFQAGHASSILVTRSSTSWPGQTGFRRTLTLGPLPDQGEVPTEGCRTVQTDEHTTVGFGIGVGVQMVTQLRHSGWRSKQTSTSLGP